MVQISRALAFFALASTALALAVNSDATSVKGATVGDTDETVSPDFFVSLFITK